MKKAVGFDQKLQLHQLDYIARELTRTESRQQMYDLVDQYLMSDIAGAKSRLNARTILFKIWVSVDKENEELRDRAIQMFNNASNYERLLLHWGQIIIAYPFFKDLVEQAGRMIQLHGEFSSIQITRKMMSIYGERERVRVAIFAVLRTLRSLGVIVENEKFYIPSDKMEIQQLDIKLWLTEVLLKATERSVIELKQISNEPIIFPFAMEIGESEMRNSKLQVMRQGIDMAMVGLK
jgi:hypothetical protein